MHSTGFDRRSACAYVQSDWNSACGQQLCMTKIRQQRHSRHGQARHIFYSAKEVVTKARSFTHLVRYDCATPAFLFDHQSCLLLPALAQIRTQGQYTLADGPSSSPRADRAFLLSMFESCLPCIKSAHASRFSRLKSHLP